MTFFYLLLILLGHHVYSQKETQQVIDQVMRAAEEKKIALSTSTIASTTTTLTTTTITDISCPKHDKFNGHLRLEQQAVVLQDDAIEEKCSHEDRGTCGNACCTLQAVAVTGCGSACAVKKLSNILQELPGVLVNNISDVRKLTVGHFRHDTVEYLLSATRIGADQRSQNILFSIGGSDLNHDQALVKGFSESKVVGAFRDYGQNYRNLYEVFKSMGEGTTTVLLHGCGRNGLIREQGSNVLLIGAGTVGLVIGGVIAVILQLLSNTNGKAKRRNGQRLNQD